MILFHRRLLKEPRPKLLKAYPIPTFWILLLYLFNNDIILDLLLETRKQLFITILFYSNEINITFLLWPRKYIILSYIPSAFQRIWLVFLIMYGILWGKEFPLMAVFNFVESSFPDPSLGCIFQGLYNLFEFESLVWEMLLWIKMILTFK